MKPQDNISAHVGKRSIRAASELTAQLNKRQFKGTDIGIGYRTLNVWENAGLFDNNREGGQRWRRFSFVEFVWIRMIDQMRTLGLPIDSIREIKEEAMVATPLMDVWTLMASLGEFGKLGDPDLSPDERQGFQDFFAKLLEDPEEDQEEETVTLLQLLIANAITKRCPIILIVFAHGDFFWIEEHPEFVTPPDFRDRMSYEPHMRISVTGIIKEFLIGDLAFERIDNLQILDPNEAFLLRAVHSGEYDSIRINFRNQRMDSMELVKNQTTTRKIVDVLAEAEYQDISIVQHKGRVTRIENTVKHRFTEK